MKTWDSEKWLQAFNGEGADYRALRREVWADTLEIVSAGKYVLPDGRIVRIANGKSMIRGSRLYHRCFETTWKNRREYETKVTVVPYDCLDVARKWVRRGLSVSVLNMANRHMPGGGVRGGAGAQEEYLFRCSDYYRSLYRYAPFAEEYGLTKSHWNYPLDRNYGGVYSPGVTVFRGSEATGYRLLEEPFQVNMIAVAGMNCPRVEDGRIAPDLTEGVRNKIRTIFRIAIDHEQTNLVLGALGCGAFHNPPRHVAELFREVLFEEEFDGAFERVCFAIKDDHNSRGDSNYIAFRDVLDGLSLSLPITQFAVARDAVVILKADGSVRARNLYTGVSEMVQNMAGIQAIAAGFDHVLGLRGDGRVVVGGPCKQATSARMIDWQDAAKVYACEGASAAIAMDGTVIVRSDGEGSQRPYGGSIPGRQDIRQLAPTFDCLYALTNDGRFLSENLVLNSFFNDGTPLIRQIAAFQCYFSMLTIAALYEDGTVKGMCDGEEITETRSWHGIRKICCGNHAAVVGLTEDGRVLFPKFCNYHDNSGACFDTLEGIVDIDASYDHLVALTRGGELICLKDD